MKLEIESDNSCVTIFKIVAFAQKYHKGQHFCALNIRYTSGYIEFEPCIYQGPLPDDQVSNWVMPVSFLSVQTCIFEHFLQSVRKSFPGVSFNDIHIQFTTNQKRTWQRVF